MEKKDPPIITNIKKKNDKLVEPLSKEKPIFEILLVRDNSNLPRLLSKLKKIKEISTKIKK